MLRYRYSPRRYARSAIGKEEAAAMALSPAALSPAIARHGVKNAVGFGAGAIAPVGYEGDTRDG